MIFASKVYRMERRLFWLWFSYTYHAGTLKKFFLLVELRLFFVVQIEITNLKHNFFIMWFSLLNYIELVLIKDVWCHINIS